MFDCYLSSLINGVKWHYRLPLSETYNLRRRRIMKIMRRMIKMKRRMMSMMTHQNWTHICFCLYFLQFSPVWTQVSINAPPWLQSFPLCLRNLRKREAAECFWDEWFVRRAVFQPLAPRHSCFGPQTRLSFRARTRHEGGGEKGEEGEEGGEGGKEG